MNDVEIELMKNLLSMDPYQRFTARQAIEHEWFDELRKKDPDYACDEESSVDGTLGEDQDTGHIILNNKRILSPELLN